MTVAVAGAVAAGGCCLAPARRRARALAVVMAVACVPLLGETVRMAAALVLLMLAMLLSVGLRRRGPGERALDLHRSVGGALMAGMLIAGGHGAGHEAVHAHGSSLSPHLVFAAAASLYVVWTMVALARPAHRPAAVAARIEMGAMGLMFALAVLAMSFG